VYWQRPIATLLKRFPELQNLCFNYPSSQHFSETIPRHHLTTLFLVVDGDNPTLCLARVLELCGTTVRDLTLTLPDKAHCSYELPSLSSGAGAGLHIIRWRDFNLLRSPRSGVTQLLSRLPALRYLNMGHFPLPTSPINFDLATRHLQSVRLWLYYCTSDSILSLTQYVLLPITLRRHTTRIELQSCNLNDPRCHDLSPLCRLCEDADIALVCIDNEWYRGYFVVDIFFFVSCSSAMNNRQF
jgi:hypothetical protein